MTRHGRLAIGAILAGVAVAFAGGVAAFGGGSGTAPATSIEIAIHYSRFEPSAITVPAGVPVTITVRNDDPIDHEWIVGDAHVHANHRTSTELLHPTRPTELVIPAGETRVTTITFEATGSLQFICHLPAHEAYGMVGVLTIR